VTIILVLREFGAGRMKITKAACFLGTLLLISELICNAVASTSSTDASTATLSFRGIGITVDLTFPTEAHPAETITHNVTITANISLSLQSFSLFIDAPVNSTLQEVKNRTISWDFLANETLTSRIEFNLPQDTNGTLYCEITMQTNQSPDYSDYKFYTTQVSAITFSEMQSIYNSLFANYTELQANYTTLLNNYNGLLANYSSLFSNYTALVNERNDLSTKYNGQVATYQSLLNSYNSLSTDYSTLNSQYMSKLNAYNDLEVNYTSLNSTNSDIQANYTSLKTIFNSLNQTYAELQGELSDLQQRTTSSENAVGTDRIVMIIFLVAVVCLIALIVYIKRKQPEPYVVIRKETVALKPDKE
jgi:hypothetical protein